MPVISPPVGTNNLKLVPFLTRSRIGVHWLSLGIATIGRSHAPWWLLGPVLVGHVLAELIVARTVQFAWDGSGELSIIETVGKVHRTLALVGLHSDLTVQVLRGDKVALFRGSAAMLEIITPSRGEARAAEEQIRGLLSSTILGGVEGLPVRIDLRRPVEMGGRALSAALSAWIAIGWSPVVSLLFALTVVPPLSDIVAVLWSRLGTLRAPA